MLIEYDVVRTIRSSIGITVERDGTIIVNAPQALGEEEIDRYVWKKRLWIWEKLAIKKSHQVNEVGKKFVSGESFYYLGRQYRLDIVGEDVPLKLKDGWFRLGKKHQCKAKECFKTWYSEHLKNKIAERLKFIVGRLNIDLPEFRVMELGYRWGSCTKEGILNFNWKIAMAPMGVIDYVIIHEIAHIKEHTHNERFWKNVQRMMPNYLEYKEWLKCNGVFLSF